MAVGVFLVPATVYLLLLQTGTPGILVFPEGTGNCQLPQAKQSQHWCVICVHMLRGFHPILLGQ